MDFSAASDPGSLALVGDQTLIEHHRPDEGLHLLPAGFHGELREPLDPLGRIWGERVEAQPARPHEDEPADPVGIIQREPHGGASAERVPD
jgi:hypothetical protein